MTAATIIRKFFKTLIKEHHKNLWRNIFIRYELSDGQKRKENGILRNEIVREDENKQFLAVTGSYEFIGTDGFVYRTDFTADEVQLSLLESDFSKLICICLLSEVIAPG